MITAVKLISKLIYFATCWPSLFRSQLTLNGRWCDCSTKDTTTRTGAILAIFSILFCSQFWQFPVLILAILATFSIFFWNQVWSLLYLFSYSLRQILLLLRLEWCDPWVWLCMSCSCVFHGEVVFVVDGRTKENPCCWLRNKTKAMLLMQKQNKSHFVDAATKQRPCYNNWRP